MKKYLLHIITFFICIGINIQAGAMNNAEVEEVNDIFLTREVASSKTNFLERAESSTIVPLSKKFVEIELVRSNYKPEFDKKSFDKLLIFYDIYWCN